MREQPNFLSHRWFGPDNGSNLRLHLKRTLQEKLARSELARLTPDSRPATDEKERLQAVIEFLDSLEAAELRDEQR